VFLVGHVTKEGAIAGPRVLEHMVDTVLYLEGDQFHAYRLLRAVKNRFGATSEVGFSRCGRPGWRSSESVGGVPGGACGECTRLGGGGDHSGSPATPGRGARAEQPFFVRHPRRTANGVDLNRLLLTVAVLQRRVGVHLAEQDVFVNVVGGLRIDEPGVDLAIAAALASSVRDRAIAAEVALIGEIGLSGEVRSVPQLEVRLNEAGRLGFRRVIIPWSLSGRFSRPPG